MKRKINYFNIIFGFVILLCSQIVFSQGDKTNLEKTEQKQCGLITKGIEFCIESPSFSVEVGQDVVIMYSMKNITDEDINTRFGRNSRKEHFTITITDESGNKIPTILEKLAEKQKNGTLSQEETEVLNKSMVRSGHGPATFCIEPIETIKWNLNLSKSYSFDTKGKYYVEISRNDSQQNEDKNTISSLGKVEIEIK